ncbi:MAG: oxygen-independent coproporphyrinogen III oxidase [Bacteroidetes bacterium]|nr:oxygen-independent coproporphyrinogen III oxidase [Bacteroidota bacterium]
MENLISKYNVSSPRYTSYPTVPYWNVKPPAQEEWLSTVKTSFDESNHKDGISLYIHLPFCESLCTYCACNTRITINHKVEMPYIEAVLKEWAMYLAVFKDRPKIKEIHLGGGTPTFFSSENLKLLIEGILAPSHISSDAEFSFEAHPNNTTSSHLQSLYELGFRRVSFGIQDFDPKVQEIINRMQTYQQVQDSVKACRQIGYTSINFDLIYGLPLQTKNSVSDTIKQVKQLKPDRIAFYSYAHVPWVKPGQRKFTDADVPVDTEKRILYETGRDMLKEAGYEEIGMDHFSLKSDSLYKAALAKNLHRNFMGYTHNYTRLMIGLGVSSISDTWNGFMQNVKKVEEYEALIKKEEFPIFKGHILTEEDLILRKHILNIITRFQTSWADEKEQCHELYKALERLTEMEKDNLLSLEPYRLTVTTKGRAFLRNICMAFDARLWQNLPQSQIFSTSA